MPTGGNRTSHDVLTITSSTSSSGVVNVDFQGSNDITDSAQVGETVDVEVWRGRDVAVQAGDLEPTTAMPSVAVTVDFGVALLALGLTVFFLLAAADLRFGLTGPLDTWPSVPRTARQGCVAGAYILSLLTSLTALLGMEIFPDAGTTLMAVGAEAVVLVGIGLVFLVRPRWRLE